MREALYNSCEDLPIGRFMRAVDTGNLGWIVKKRGILKADRAKRWEDIFNEYASLSGDGQSVMILGLMKSVFIKQNKLAVIDETVRLLRLRHNTELVDVLKRLGFRKKFTPGENYQKDLNFVIIEARKILMQLKKDQEKLKELQTTEKSKKGDFEKLLARMSEHQGYRIDPEIVTVLEFLAIEKNILENGKRAENLGNNRR